ncbi:MAG TPA: BamA/TamA family outer membrane protein [Vicinamibacteria bacterium]|nr:BamA/TamA family outer membrane protein [Vicinamibacteria bacterium]
MPGAARRDTFPTALLLIGLSLSAATPARAASYPPQYHFQTVSTDRVSVHFHEGLEPMARQAAAMATEILARHEARYGQRVGRVHIVLVDAEDDSNGFTTPLPFPLVTLHAVAPDGTDDFGNHEGWLRLVLTHELAHSVHLEEARGLWGFGRKVLGRAPFLFPNTFAMSWMIEGLAVYEETEGTAFGRGRNPDSAMILRMAALEGRFPKEDQAIYALDAWPGGETPYVFGEAFLRRLTEQTGEETIPRMGRQHATQFPPFLDGRTARKVTGTGLHAGWQAWAEEATRAFERDAAAREARGLTEGRPLTARGIRQVAPHFSPDGQWVAYTSVTLTRFPEIRLVRPDGRDDRRVVLRNGGTGLAWTPDGKALVFDEFQVHGTFSLFGDLSLVDVATGHVRRITRGVRAYDADVSPDGRAVVFARKMGDRSELFTVGLDGQGLAAMTASAAGVEWSGPHWSPRGDAVVAARLLPGGWLDLVRVDPATGAVEQLTHDRAKDVEPTLTPDGAEVVFRSDRDGVSNLYALRLADRSVVRVTNVLGGAFQPSVSPDGGSVAYAAYSAAGYDVHVAPLDLASAAPAEPYVDDHPAPRPDPLPAQGEVRPYRPGSMLLPRFWTPWVELGDTEDRVGLATGGSDALFRHIWAARATYGTGSERINASGFYLYDRFRPTFLVAAEDDTSYSTSGLLRTTQIDLEATMPLRRTVRSIQSLSATWRREREQVPGSSRPGDRTDFGGIETAWTISNALRYPYSISPTEGGQLQVAWLHEAKALGSDLSLDKLTVDARLYQRAIGERDVLALRAGGGTTWGEPQFTRSFAVGGYGDVGLFDIVRSNDAVLRGYPDNAFTGRSYAAVNAEYRFPLFSPQRGWRSLPVFLRHFRGTVFFDAANAWSGTFRVADLKTSAGASVGLDSAIGFALPLTAELSLARGFDEKGDTKVYFRFGLAF